MSRIVVLVMLDPDDPDAHPFRQCIAQDPELASRVDLRFAAGESIATAIVDAEVVVGAHLPAERLAQAPRLKWMSFWSAGLDGKITPELLQRGLILTNASGVHGPNIAEHVLACMLMFTRRMHLYLRKQIAREWWRQSDAEELTGQTLGIVGLGRIGEALTIRAKAFGMRVIATKRNPNTRYDPAATPDILLPPERLHHLLAEADHVCVAVPYTPETHHLINAAALGRMKPTAYLYNIARGRVVDEPALIAALQEGRIAGAGLDVFETEPLPPDSPLWRMENVILTPHVSGLTPHYFTRTAALFVENLRRYLRGAPLLNRYDPDRGY